MRLASQAKGGFYPFNNAAIVKLSRLLKPESPDFTIIDPCCGEGMALLEIGACTGCKPENLFGIELETRRQEKARSIHPDAKILGPASFFDTKITPHSFGLAWVNPPFDDEAGGGHRVELSFLVRATDVIAPGGVICFVIPETQIGTTWSTREVTRYLMERYQNVVTVLPDEEHRPYREVVVIGTKRRQPVEWDYTAPPVQSVSNVRTFWKIPATMRPGRFEKCGMTDDELIEAVCKSPLWSVTREPKRIMPGRPPLTISKGHIALLLASGECDGVVCPEGEPPHLVKGTARKVKLDPIVTVDEDAQGRLKTTTVITEEIKLVIRAATPDGEIRTFE